MSKVWLCEHCFSPVSSLNFICGGYAQKNRHLLATSEGAVQVTDWPGTFGLAVYFHPPCYDQALRRLKHR